MKNTDRLPVLLFAAMLSSPAVWSAVEDISDECDACHGQDGVSQRSDVPTIAGMSDFVLSEAMFIYRDRERPCRESEYRHGETERPPTTMCDVAQDLDDGEIEAIAKHYAAQAFVPAKQDFDPAKAEVGARIHREKCDKCHTDGGSNPEDDAGLIAGQWTPYLEQAFADYQSGDREVLDEKMQEKLDELDAGMIDALIHYYASQQ